jgi:hypothetical protein
MFGPCIKLACVGRRARVTLALVGIDIAACAYPFMYIPSTRYVVLVRRRIVVYMDAVFGFIPCTGMRMRWSIVL